MAEMNSAELAWWRREWIALQNYSQNKPAAKQVDWHLVPREMKEYYRTQADKTIVKFRAKVEAAQQEVA